MQRPVFPVPARCRLQSPGDQREPRPGPLQPAHEHRRLGGPPEAHGDEVPWSFCAWPFRRSCRGRGAPYPLYLALPKGQCHRFGHASPGVARRREPQTR